LVTGSDLKVSGQTNVFALGDCARCRKVPYAATAQVAMQQAPVAAWNVYATLHNLENKNNAQDDLKLLPFQYLALGEMMTLGSDDATISGLEGLVNLSGEAASVLRRLVYAIRMPTPQQGFSAVLQSTQRRIQLRRQKGVNAKAKKQIAPDKMKWK
jgi:NADH:ubiquinone reductase (non-electrogenic)